MTILETFIKLRDDLKLWVTNNLNMKASITYVDEVINEAKEDASNKDAVILFEAQKGIADLQTQLNTKADADHTHSEFALVSDVEALDTKIGDTSVSEQITTAINNIDHPVYAAEESVNTSTEVINADTLGGKLPSSFAPAGYGLGESTQEPLDNDLNNATKCGWCAFTSSTANRPFDYGTVMVTNRYGNQITQLAFNPYMAGNGETCVRHYYDGWKEWEYINPPMKTGVEYRTTERWNGKVVYTKLVSFTMPNNTNLNVNCLTPAWTVIDYDVVMVKPGLSMKLPYFDANGVMQARVVCNTNSSVIQILTKSDLSSYTGYATIKYTKD